MLFGLDQRTDVIYQETLKVNILLARKQHCYFARKQRLWVLTLADEHIAFNRLLTVEKSYH
jgi:hypothetical protein